MESKDDIIAKLKGELPITPIGNRRRKPSKKGLRNQLFKQLRNDPEFWDSVWAEYLALKPLESIARGYAIPKMTLYKWIREDEQQRQMKEECDQIRADTSAERIQEIGGMALKDDDGNFHHHKARIALDALKWSAEKGNPSKYGHKQEIKIEKSVRQEHVHQLRELSKIKDVTPQKKQITSGDKS